MFARFESTLRALPSRSTYAQSDLLIPELLISSEDRLCMYYAPIDWTNHNAQVVLLGITPGWTQMELAYRGAAAPIAARASPETVVRAAKSLGAFAGSIRNNMLRMLDDIGLPQALGIAASSELFGSASALLHTTSVIRYPVFVETRNYTGTPAPMTSPMLAEMARTILVSELKSVPSALIVPLGKAVEGTLDTLAREGSLNPNRWLSGFPHPSGANGHRVRIFNENRRSLARQTQQILSRLRGAV